MAGGILLGIGLSDQAAVEDPAPNTRWEDVEGAYERGPALITSGLVLLPAGVVIAALGLVWGIVGSSGGGGESVSLRIGPGSIGVSGRF